MSVRSTGLPESVPGWSDWAVLPIGPLSPEVLRELLDGGQAFRWTPLADSTWLGVFGRSVVRLARDADSVVHWSAPAEQQEATATALHRYFDLDRDARELADQLPWRTDAHLARCRDRFGGLRILRQPFGETLLGFLCSATKQIVQIKQMVALLAARHGTALTVPPLPSSPDGPLAAPVAFFALPTWDQLALVPEADLRRCLLGFRARYIHDTAAFVAAHPGWLEETEALPYAEARARLCSLPGVGEKVADCVLLFGAGRLESFPVDVWIIRAMATRYGLGGWKPAQIAHFGRVHYGPLAGLAQQYLFAAERAAGRSTPPQVDAGVAEARRNTRQGKK
jgi:N-glycosylase/DNA lyase